MLLVPSVVDTCPRVVSIFYSTFLFCSKNSITYSALIGRPATNWEVESRSGWQTARSRWNGGHRVEHPKYSGKIQILVKKEYGKANKVLSISQSNYHCVYLKQFSWEISNKFYFSETKNTMKYLHMNSSEWIVFVNQIYLGRFKK